MLDFITGGATLTEAVVPELMDKLKNGVRILPKNSKMRCSRVWFKGKDGLFFEGDERVSYTGRLEATLEGDKEVEVYFGADQPLNTEMSKRAEKNTNEKGETIYVSDNGRAYRKCTPFTGEFSGWYLLEYICC